MLDQRTDVKRLRLIIERSIRAFPHSHIYDALGTHRYMQLLPHPLPHVINAATV